MLNARIDNPLPIGLVWLNLALPGVWLAGRFLARRVGGDAASRRLLAPGIGTAVWLLAVHAAARLLGDFPTGLVVGTLGVAAAGVAALADRRQAAGDDAGPRATLMWATALVATAVIAPTALGWSFHDEVPFTGHLSIAAQMQNGP